MSDLPASSDGKPLFVWTGATRKFEFHLRPDVIGRLGIESWMAFKQVPRRGLEIGGILLGRTDTQADTTTFWVEGFQPVESEHRFGPSYLLSESDLTLLRAEVSNTGPAGLGIYRSQTRSEQLALEPADIEMLDRCFEAGTALFLMLGPAPGKAAFYCRTDGQLNCVHEFTLASSLSAIMSLQQSQQNRSSHRANRHARVSLEIQSMPPDVPKQLAPPEDPVFLAVSGPSSVASPSLDIQPTPGPVIKRSMGSGIRRAGWITAAAITLLVLAATANTLSGRLQRSLSPDTRAPRFIHLNVERSGSALRLVWDGNSLGARGAARAILHIEDGGNRIDRDLESSEFSAGNYTYEPTSAEVTFHLDVYSEEPNASGVLQVMTLAPQPAVARVTAPSPPPPSSVAPPATATPLARAVPPPVIGTWRWTPSPIRTFSPPSAGAPVAAAAAAGDSATSSNTSSWTSSSNNAPRPEAAAHAQPEMDSPDRWNAPERIAYARSTARPVSSAPPTATDSSAPSVQMSSEPASGKWIHVLREIPLLRRFTKQRIVAPVPVYQAKPILKTPAQKLDQAASIGVKVDVGESGTVMNAEVVDYGDPPNWDLVSASLAAAKRWTFQPARVEDTIVQAQMVIHFRFTP